MKTENEICTRARRHCPVGLLAGAMIGMAATLWGQAPELITNNAMVLSWQQNETSYIVTESPTVDGLYTPSLLPLMFGGNRVAVMTSEPATRFFQLAQGGQVLEDFSRGTDYAWSVSDSAQNYRISYPNGALRIEKDPGVESGTLTLNPPVWISGSWPHCTDVTISVDILDWDETAIGQTIAFGARFSSPDGNGYWPRFRIIDQDSGLAVLGQPKLTDGDFETVTRTSFDLGAKRPLRLVYSLAGSVHTMAVYDLADLGDGPIHLSTGYDSSYDEGLFCLWFGNGGNPALCDLTIDNIVMTWTSP